MKTRLLACAGIATLAFLAEGLWVYAFLPHPADASRNSSGTYSTPNTFVPGTTISSTSMNANFSDLATEMTASLERSGKGGMLAALRGTDGTVAAPAFSFTSETGSGLYRIGSSDLGLAISGTKKLELTSSLFTVTPNASFTGVLLGSNGAVGAPTYSFTNDATSGLYRGGSNDIRFAVNGADVTAWGASGITSAPLLIYGAGQTAATPTTASSLGGALILGDSGGAAGNGGMLVFSANTSTSRFAAIKGMFTDGTSNSVGDILFATRSGAADSTLTERARIVGGASGGLKVGASGTTTAQMNFGSCLTNAGTPSVCTATVASGAKCISGQVNAAASADTCNASVSSTTLTLTTANGIAHTCGYVCF